MCQCPALGADRGKVTKPPEGGLSRRLGRKSFTLEPTDQHRDVLLQLVIDLVVDGRLPEEPLPGTKQLSHRQAGLSTRAIALAMASHWAVCARSSARPAGVRA